MRKAPPSSHSRQQGLKGLKAGFVIYTADKEIYTFKLTNEYDADAFVENDPQDEAILRSVFTDASGFVLAYPYAENWIRGFQREGLKVFCLSNWSEKMLNDCRDELHFLDVLDGVIFSWQENLVKPDPAIYQCLLQRYHLKAETCIFVDDSRANVEAARVEGMHGVIFESQKQADQEIREIQREQSI